MFTKDNAYLLRGGISFKARSSVDIISLDVDYHKHLKCRIIFILRCENESQNLRIHFDNFGLVRRSIVLYFPIMTKGTNLS